MTQPFLRIPEPEIPRPFKRRFQPNATQLAVRDTWNRVRRQSAEALAERQASRSRALAQGKRHPRISA